MATTTAPARTDPNRAVAVWLAFCAAMVLAMVVLGGATRLSGAGLSMVTWQPLLGVLPPLGPAEWEAVFRAYQASPEFRTVNFWMTVEDFKTIFWLEYFHRMWGRLIGVVFFFPYLWFLLRRRLNRNLALRLAGVFALGAAQGLLGWYMVKSGLADRPEVSQYRLAAHLGLAFLIYALLVWPMFELLATRSQRQKSRGTRGLRRLARWILGWAALTVIAGAFVAGIDAGLAYNTFPLMEGRVVPQLALALEPWPYNFFENPALVQFNHRVLGIGLCGLVLWQWARATRATVAWRAHVAIDSLTAMTLLQAGLGVATLLTHVAMPLAILHQFGALVVFTLALWMVYELGPKD
jgi:cytochrome c oxidase assembly protein subunit 15